MDKLSIVEALDSYFPNFDGPVHVVSNYSKSFNKRNDVEVNIIVPKYKKYKDENSSNILRVASIAGPENYQIAVPEFDTKIKKFFKDNKIDIIHIHSPFTMGRYLAKLGKKLGIPTIFTFHTKFKSDFERVLKNKNLQKFMMNYIMKTIKMCDYVLTVSDGAAETLREYGYKGKIEVVRNGTDLVQPDNIEELIDIINKKYNIADEKNVFLSVGRIVENKRLDVSIQALKLVKEKGYKFKFLIVGAGDYEKQLKDLVKKLGLEEDVIFTGKIMDRKLLSAHYLRSDLFLFPSTFDTASLAPIEAAALKLPTLMTLGCSTAEIINENVNGYLAKESDFEDWADKIIYVINNKEKLTEVKENAFNQVYRTWDDVTDEILKKYKEYIEDYKLSHNNNGKHKK